mgnify:CR=1 FL=1
MGWSDCGTDSEGRPIGYGHDATCDHPGCTKQIDRGLAYACGGMHGSDDISCERYCCYEHLHMVEVDGRGIQLCSECLKAFGQEG